MGEALQKENQELKQTVDRLEAEKTSLMSKIAGLEDDLKEARENVKANIDEKMDEDQKAKTEEKPENNDDKESNADELAPKAADPEDEPMETEENEIDTTGQPTQPAESSELDKKSSEETVKETKDNVAVPPLSPKKTENIEDDKPVAEQKADEKIDTDEAAKPEKNRGRTY